MAKVFACSRFSFRMFPAWQFWKRGIGIGRVAAVEGNIVHLQILGVGPAVIAHLPILKDRVEAVARGVVADPQVGRDEITMKAIADWQIVHSCSDAGVFAVSLPDAIRAVFETADGLCDSEYVETAYPRRASDGTFRRVQVITAPTA